jgi:hypothetical protein
MNRIEEAKEVFAAMYEVPIDSSTVSANVRDIQLSLELAQNVSLAALVKMGPQRTFHRVILAATIQMFLQMTGVNAITSYASTIYEASTYPYFLTTSTLHYVG